MGVRVVYENHWIEHRSFVTYMYTIRSLGSIHYTNPGSEEDLSNLVWGGEKLGGGFSTLLG